MGASWAPPPHAVLAFVLMRAVAQLLDEFAAQKSWVDF